MNLGDHPRFTLMVRSTHQVMGAFGSDFELGIPKELSQDLGAGLRADHCDVSELAIPRLGHDS